MTEEFETGVNTGDARENAPDAAGYTDEHDRLFRSHFQHANHLGDQGFEDVRPAYYLGLDAATDPSHTGKPFEEVEKDLENGWLNVRTRGGAWASVRDYAREGFERGRALGFVTETGALGETPSHERATFADPVPDGIDPTAPDSPEQTLDYQRDQSL